MLDFPATARNREPIARVLSELFEPDCSRRLLEVASGSGQHAAFLADRFENWEIYPTDLEPQHVESIEAYREEAALPNLHPARCLDVQQKWPEFGEPFDGILAINLIHISAWEITLRLLEASSEHLKKGGFLYLYGAYQREGSHTSASNQAFHQSLVAQNPAWGVRHLEDVEQAAARHGLHLHRVVEMPANNLSVVFVATSN